MNLTTGKWIPVVWEDGKSDKVNLLDVFQKGDSIRDLAVRPHERIALMRLLICVTQAALNGPKNRDEWQTCRSRLPQAVTDYLGKWKYAFELFGDGQRFLQVADLQTVKAGDNDGESSSPSKLDLTLSTGNNTTLFDNAGGSERRFNPDALALALLTFQNFSPGGLIGNVRWHGTIMGRSSTHAPCVVKGMLHSYAKRACLLDTVWDNLLSKEDMVLLRVEWGRPVWEMPPDGPQSNSTTKNATTSYLGRLVPLCRAIRLGTLGDTMVLGGGLAYDAGWREPAATWVVRERNGKPERAPLGVSLAKGLWREAHAITVLATAEDHVLGGPLVLTARTKRETMDVWCGALAANKSKLLDTVEAVLHIPASMFATEGHRLYQQGVACAENRGRMLNRAVSACHRAMKDELDKAEFRNRGNLVKAKAASHYWTAIEQKVPLLLALVEDPAPLRPDGSMREQWSTTDWGKALATAAREAYELACPRATSRQLQAYATGLNVLFRPIEEDRTDERNTEEDTNEGSMD